MNVKQIPLIIPSLEPDEKLPRPGWPSCARQALKTSCW